MVQSYQDDLKIAAFDSSIKSPQNYCHNLGGQRAWDQNLLSCLDIYDVSILEQRITEDVGIRNKDKNYFIVNKYIDVQYLSATRGGEIQRLLWYLDSVLESNDPKYII